MYEQQSPWRKISSSSPISTKFKPWGVALKLFSCLQQHCIVISALHKHLWGILTAWWGWQGWPCPLCHPTELSPKLFPGKRRGRTITIAESRMPPLPLSWPHGSSERLLVYFHMMETRHYEFQLEFLCTQCSLHPLGLCKFRSHASHTSFHPAICHHPH